MLMRPDSPGLKFMLLGNSGDAGFSVDGQLMTSLRLSRFQQARREAETVWWSLGPIRPPQEVYAAVWARFTRQALAAHVGFGAGRPQWWQSFDFWVSLLAGLHLVLQRDAF